jgi:5-methyltetrahydropteroyltriglutamate--homocysteine methyltransferase
MAHRPPPFRAETVGSFLRPPVIKDLRAKLAEGKLGRDELRAIEDQQIREVVALQEEIGLKVATDGEFRRATYSENFTTQGLSGVSAEYVGAGDWAYSDGKGGKRTARIPVVSGKIKYAGSTNAADFSFLASCVKTAMPKITLPGPCYIHYRSGRDNISRDVYPNLDDFWADLATAYHAELAALHAAGCRYVQLDETSIAKLGDPKIQNALAARGDNWRDLLEVYTDAMNAIVDGAPKDMHVAMHLCRGNQAGHWQAEGGYDAVAERLFRKVKVATYFLEYDSPRAGSFEPLKALPDDKTIVLGVVSTKVATVETADFVRNRLKEASAYVPLDRLCLSPQCGFASSVPGNPLTEKEQREKLELIVAVARETWADA